MEELEIDLQRETGRRKTLEMEAISMKEDKSIIDAQRDPVMAVKVQYSTQIKVSTSTLPIPILPCINIIFLFKIGWIT